MLQLSVEFDHEADGRWIASVPALARVHVYGGTRDDAIAKVVALVYATLADEVSHGERDSVSLGDLKLDFGAPEKAA